MKTATRKARNSDLHPVQNGELIIGMSSAIPGFIKKSTAQNAISFAPFYLRDHWVDLPTAIIRKTAPVSNGNSKNQKSVAFALRPGNEKVLIDIIGALTRTPLARSNGTARAKDPSVGGNGPSGICCSCTRGDAYCVDCYLAM